MANTIADAVDAVYFVLAEPDSSIISTAALTSIVTNNSEYYDLDDDWCQLLYVSTISAMNYIIRKLGGSGAGLGGSSASQKEGSVTVSESYGEGSGVVDFWEDELDRFRNNPATLLPCMRDADYSSAQPYIIFGGVNRDTFEDYENNTDILDAEGEAFLDIDAQLNMPKRILRG